MPSPLQLGAYGADVKRLKEALVAQGYFVGAVDEDFGLEADAAVRYFQSVCGVPIDGIADQQVYDYLGITDEDVDQQV